ncbi:hypothetical protein TH0011_15120 [Helicobacter pylori]
MRQALANAHKPCDVRIDGPMMSEGWVEGVLLVSAGGGGGG